MDFLSALGAIFAAGVMLVLGSIPVSLILRASKDTANNALTMLAVGALVICIGCAIYIILLGVANIRQARWPKPSHQIDNRQQHIDARTQRVELPAGTRSLEP